MADSNYIEVELRGPLTKQQAEKLDHILSEKGSYIRDTDRIFIDYSVFIEGEGIRERERDVRVRVTNGESEIIIKTGAAGSYEDRREYSVKTKNSFDELVQTMAVLGFKKGICGRRLGKIYNYDNCEFVIYEVPNHSYYFEIDTMTNPNNKHDALNKLKILCDEFGLRTFTQAELHDYMELLNRDSNYIYDADAEPDNYFELRYGV